jgi:hypothetical protein
VYSLTNINIVSNQNKTGDKNGYTNKSIPKAGHSRNDENME